MLCLQIRGNRYYCLQQLCETTKVGELHPRLNRLARPCKRNAAGGRLGLELATKCIQLCATQVARSSQTSSPLESWQDHARHQVQTIFRYVVMDLLRCSGLLVGFCWTATRGSDGNETSQPSIPVIVRNKIIVNKDILIECIVRQGVEHQYFVSLQTEQSDQTGWISAVAKITTMEAIKTRKRMSQCQ